MALRNPVDGHAGIQTLRGVPRGIVNYLKPAIRPMPKTRLPVKGRDHVLDESREKHLDKIQTGEDNGYSYDGDVVPPVKCKKGHLFSHMTD